MIKIERCYLQRRILFSRKFHEGVIMLKEKHNHIIQISFGFGGIKGK